MQREDGTFGLVLAAIAPFFFAGVLLILRIQAGVTWKLKFDPGPPLRTSMRGCGSINGVHVSYLDLQVVEHPKGWLICMLPTYFFGVL